MVVHRLKLRVMAQSSSSTQKGRLPAESVNSLLNLVPLGIRLQMEIRSGAFKKPIDYIMPKRPKINIAFSLVVKRSLLLGL